MALSCGWMQSSISGKVLKPLLDDFIMLMILQGQDSLPHPRKQTRHFYLCRWRCHWEYDRTRKTWVARSNEEKRDTPLHLCLCSSIKHTSNIVQRVNGADCQLMHPSKIITIKTKFIKEKSPVIPLLSWIICICTSQVFKEEINVY